MVDRIISPLGAIVTLWAITDLVRAAALLVEGPLHVTTLSPLIALLGYLPVAILCAISGIGCLYAILSPRRSYLGFGFILLQQALLVLFAIGPVTAIITSQFADGVIRNRGFLLADQLPHVAPVLVHMAAVAAYWLPYWGVGWRER